MYHTLPIPYDCLPSHRFRSLDAAFKFNLQALVSIPAGPSATTAATATTSPDGHDGVGNGGRAARSSRR
jgi:hypothetical protein